MLLIASPSHPQGLRPDLVTVYTDGLWDDTASVCRVFGTRLVAHPKFNTTSTRGPRFAAADQIALHYKYGASG
jgi:hypothetical protein